MDQIRTEWLRTFLAAVEAGSFTAAARRVHRSQSAVSLQMAQLEEAVGAVLLTRGARRLTLTAAGERLLPEVRRAVESLQSLVGVFGQASPVPLRLGMLDEYADGPLPGVIARFAQSHPEIELEVICASSARLGQRFADGDLDLALVLQEEVSLAGTVVAVDATCWARSAAAGPQHGAPLPVALFDQDCSWRRWALHSLEAAGLAYRVVFSSGSVAAIRAALRSGAAVGVLGASTLSADLEIFLPTPARSSLPPSTLALLRASQVPAVAADRLQALLLRAFTGRPGEPAPHAAATLRGHARAGS